jgi:hypothetical protein
MIPLRGITSPATSTMLPERLLGAITGSTSSNGGVWEHPSCVREKRPYGKRDMDYWEGGGIQAVRKRQRVGNPES